MTTVPDLCHDCGAYWACEHRPEPAGVALRLDPWVGSPSVFGAVDLDIGSVVWWEEDGVIHNGETIQFSYPISLEPE